MGDLESAIGGVISSISRPGAMSTPGCANGGRGFESSGLGVTERWPAGWGAVRLDARGSEILPRLTSRVPCSAALRRVLVGRSVAAPSGGSESLLLRKKKAA